MDTIDRHFDLSIIKGIDHSDLPVFQQNWWVRIAQQSARFGEAQVYEDGVVVGSLPYIVTKRSVGLVIPWGVSPHWSHLGGPVVSQALSKAGKANVLGQLIAQLPRKIPFQFICSHLTDDAELIRQAFINAGFKYSRMVTYSQSPEEADVMGRINSKNRSHIKVADKLLEVIEISADEFTSFYEANLKAAGLVSYSPLNVARELIIKGRDRAAPQVRVIAARKRKDGSPYDAAIACAWDNERYYLWMMTHRRHDPGHDQPNRDAMKLLIVKAMDHAQSLGLTFDVDGFTKQSHEKLYKEILKVPNREFRDVFDRAMGLARLFEIYRPKIKKAAVFLCLM
jgi:hypothetical protein